MIKPTKFDTRLEVRCERKEEVRMSKGLDIKRVQDHTTRWNTLRQTGKEERRLRSLAEDP